MNEYKLYNLKIIENNHSLFVNQCLGFDISDRQNVDHINSNFYSFIPIF